MTEGVLVALFTRAWIEIAEYENGKLGKTVALFTRAWIEITLPNATRIKRCVALFTRAWIEIVFGIKALPIIFVALFTRAWIEISDYIGIDTLTARRPLYEGVDWNLYQQNTLVCCSVSPSLRGRGLKFPSDIKYVLVSKSPSLRGRGLKFSDNLGSGFES